MLREFLSGTSLYALPVVAMLLFLAIFLVVLLRVLRRGAAADYHRMSTMPLLDDDCTEPTNDERSDR